MPDKSVNKSAIIPHEMADLRFDQAVAKLWPEYSRQRLSEWIKSGEITLNHEIWRPKDKIQGGEEVSLKAYLKEQVFDAPQAFPLDIVFEDDEIIVINKPDNLVVHPAAGNHDGTLLNGLLHHCPQLAKLPRAGIVHRLDKNTTGLMVVAKTLTAHTRLVEMLAARLVSRKYLALINGQMIVGQKIEAPIGRHSRNRQKMAVLQKGKPAISHVRVKQKFLAHTLVEVTLETGRTHQIRVHLSHIEHPLVGDALYGGRSVFPKGCDDTLKLLISQFSRQALHAYSLGFAHPNREQPLRWETPLPEDFAKLLEALEPYSID